MARAFHAMGRDFGGVSTPPKPAVAAARPQRQLAPGEIHLGGASLMPLAEQIAKATGKTIVLVEFTSRVELCQIHGASS